MTSKVKDLLKFAYKEVETLESFLSHFGHVQVRKPDDSSSYLHLLETCLVGTSQSCKVGQKVLKSLNQTCHQKEIVNITIRKLLKSKGRNQNLLTYGFSEPTNNSKSDVAISYGIESSQVNSCVRLLSTAPWKLLLSRIGDELMLHLLETRSVFLALPGSNYLQVTGLPLYKEVAQVNAESCLFKGQPSGAFQETIKDRQHSGKSDACQRKRKREDSVDGERKKRRVSPDKESLDINEALAFLEDSSPEHSPMDASETSSHQGKEINQDEGVVTVKRSKSRRRRDRRKRITGQTNDIRGKRCLFTFHTPILKRSVLYVKDLREKLSKKYLLTDTLPTQEGAMHLAEKVVKQNMSNLQLSSKTVSLPEDCDQKVEDEVLKSLQPIMLEMIEKHRHCKYSFLLAAKCPLNGLNVGLREKTTATQSVRNQTQRAKNKDALKEMISWTHTPKQVFVFMRRIILKVVPLALFGTKRNQRRFLTVVETYVKLGKFEKLYQGELLNGVALKNVPWLKKIRDPRLKEYFYVTLINNLLSELVIPFITSFFYVTDNAAYRNLLFYYRKSVWKKIHKLGLQELLERKMLQSIPEERVLLETRRSLGLCSLRFLPKLSGVRPILNMAARKFKKRSINMHLSDALQALSYLTKKQHNLKESSINGVEDIYQKWHSYVLKCREKNISKLFFVKVDIQHCYDTIDQEKMMSIVRDIFPQADEANFQVRRYATINACGGRLKTMYKQDVTTLDDLEPRFKDFACKIIVETGMHSTVFVDQIYTQFEKSDYFLQKIEAHLKHNVVQVGQDVLLQCTGISQGCVLSSLLCSLYYSEMERNYLEIGADDLLMRQVDDFLYVTPDLNAAKTFLATMLNGIPEYNCETHPSKSVTNFLVKESDVQVLPSNALFPWCGLLFNTETLEVQMQTERYAGMSIKDTMTFNSGLCPGKNMQIKLQQSLRPKFAALLFDPEVNSLDCQVMNVWKAFLLCAFRCHSCLRSLQNNRMNVKFLVDMISNLPFFLRRQVGKHVINNHSKLLPRQEMSWLCFHAFILKMRQHQGRYFNLLKKLRLKQKHISKKLGQQKTEQLSQVIGNQLPEEFTFIFD